MSSGTLMSERSLLSVDYFSFRKKKRASASFVSWFSFPENNDPQKVGTPRKKRAPKATNSESSKGRYYRNLTVLVQSKSL